MCAHFTSFIICLRGGGGGGGGGGDQNVRMHIDAANFTILHTGCPSYHLTTWWKSAKSLKPKAFSQHGIAKKKKKLGINALL